MDVSLKGSEITQSKDSLSESKKDQSEKWDPSLNFADSRDYRWESKQGVNQDSLFGRSVNNAEGDKSLDE